MSVASFVSGALRAAAPASGSPAQVPAPRTAGIPDDFGPLLGRIPDMEAKPAPASPLLRLDGRIISQALSIKMVAGIGVGMVLGALLPFVFGRGSHPAKPVQELPPWSVQGAAPAASAAQEMAVPTWRPPSAAQVPPLDSQAAGPEAPHTGDYRPAALNRTDWRRPQTSAAPPYTPQTNNPNNDDFARTNPPAGATIDRGDVRPDNRRPLQADNRNDPATRYRNGPATQYRNAPAVDYRGNPIGPNPVRRDNQYVTPPSDDRYGPTDANPARQGYPPLPANNGAGVNYGNPPNTEPGVARFDGSITAPPGRTNNYRALWTEQLLGPTIAPRSEPTRRLRSQSPPRPFQRLQLRWRLPYRFRKHWPTWAAQLGKASVYWNGPKPRATRSTRCPAGRPLRILRQGPLRHLSARCWTMPWNRNSRLPMWLVKRPLVARQPPPARGYPARRRHALYRSHYRRLRPDSSRLGRRRPRTPGPRSCRSIEWSGRPFTTACKARRMAAIAEMADGLQSIGDSGRKIIGLAGCNRGEGVTTMLSAAARNLVSRGRKVALVDNNWNNPQLARSLGLLPQIGWEESLSGGLPLEEIVIESLADGLAVLPVREPPAGAIAKVAVAAGLEDVGAEFRHRARRFGIAGRHRRQEHAGAGRCLADGRRGPGAERALHAAAPHGRGPQAHGRFEIELRGHDPELCRLTPNYRKSG